MKNVLKLTTLVLLFAGIISCEKDDDDKPSPSSSTNTTNETVENNLLRVYFQNTASSSSEVQWGQRVICYTDSSCSTNNSISIRSTSDIISMLTSNDEKTSVGVEIPRIEVNNGSGKILVVEGHYKEVSGGGNEFFGEDTLFTSEEINSNDIYSLEYGTIEF